MAYKLLHREQNAAGFNMDIHINISVDKIYQMAQFYKTHQCDLDLSFVFPNLLVKISNECQIVWIFT